LREQQKQQQRAQEQQQHRQQQGGKGEGAGFYSGSGHQAWEASVRNANAGPAVGKSTRQTSSMGDQSGRQRSESESFLEASGDVG
jgi:protein kinase A